MLALHSTFIFLAHPQVSEITFSYSSDLLVRKVNGGNFQWPQGIMKCNFCEFRLIMGGNTNLCWIDQRYILRDLKLQPELCHVNWRVYVFTCVFNSRPQKWISKELRLQNYVGLPSFRKFSPQIGRLGHSWGVCLPSGSSEQQEGGSDWSAVSWFLVGTSLKLLWIPLFLCR